MAAKTHPAIVGNVSASKRGIVTKDGVYILQGSEWSYLTWREVDAIIALRTEYQGARAVELEDRT